MTKQKKKAILALVSLVAALAVGYNSLDSMMGGGQPSGGPAVSAAGMMSSGESVAGPPVLGGTAGGITKPAPSSTETTGGGAVVNEGPLAEVPVITRVETLIEKLMAQKDAAATSEASNALASLVPDELRRPAETGLLLDAGRDALSEFKLNGIIRGGDRSCALVGGYILREGDVLPSGHVIWKINRRSVHLKAEGRDDVIVKHIEPLDAGRSNDNDEDILEEEEVEPAE